MKFKNPNKLFPLFLTNKLEEVKAFYVGQAGFSAVVDVEGYLQVGLLGSDGPELCFMKPDAFPDKKPRPSFEGKGVLISVPVPDADQKLAELQAQGVTIVQGISDKPWGWRSFMVSDPAGVMLDFFHVYKEADLNSM